MQNHWDLFEKYRKTKPLNFCQIKMWYRKFAWIVTILLISCTPIQNFSTASSKTPEEAAKNVEMTMTMSTATISFTFESPKGEVQENSLYSDILQDTIYYLIYLPPGYQTNSERYPALYLLHGRGDSMHSWLAIKADIDWAIANGTVPPFIAIIPDIPYSKRASYYVDSEFTGELLPGKPVETAIIQDLVPEIDHTYRTIPNRSGRAVIGYSMGGFGALRYILKYPDIFIAAILLSPAVYVPLPPKDSSMRLFGAFGKGEKIFDETVYTEKNYPNLIPYFEESKLPAYVFIAVGDDEWRNPLPEDYEHDLDFEAARLYNRLVRTKYIVSEFRVLDGGHDWNVWRPAFLEGLRYIMRFISPPT